MQKRGVSSRVFFQFEVVYLRLVIGYRLCLGKKNGEWCYKRYWKLWKKKKKEFLGICKNLICDTLKDNPPEYPTSKLSFSHLTQGLEG